MPLLNLANQNGNFPLLILIDAAIVTEQVDIHTGEGGFDVKVDGIPRLIGGLIAAVRGEQTLVKRAYSWSTF